MNPGPMDSRSGASVETEQPLNQVNQMSESNMVTHESQQLASEEQRKTEPNLTEAGR